MRNWKLISLNVGLCDSIKFLFILCVAWLSKFTESFKVITSQSIL